MSDSRCQHKLIRGPRRSQQCLNIAVENGYCDDCLKKKCVKDSLRGQCQYIYIRGPHQGERCENKAYEAGYCLDCIAKKSVRVLLEGRCTHVISKGPRKGERCPNEAIDEGYCRDCLTKKVVRERLKAKRISESPVLTSSSEDDVLPCRLCHSERLCSVNVIGLERLLCLNCGILQGTWPLAHD